MRGEHGQGRVPGAVACLVGACLVAAAAAVGAAAWAAAQFLTFALFAHMHPGDPLPHIHGTAGPLLIVAAALAGASAGAVMTASGSGPGRTRTTAELATATALAPALFLVVELLDPLARNGGPPPELLVIGLVVHVLLGALPLLLGLALVRGFEAVVLLSVAGRYRDDVVVLSPSGEPGSHATDVWLGRHATRGPPCPARPATASRVPAPA